MQTAAFLLPHYAITMRGMHHDARAVAYLEKEAQAFEYQMDSQDATFPDLLDTAVLQRCRTGYPRYHRKVMKRTSTLNTDEGGQRGGDASQHAKGGVAQLGAPNEYVRGYQLMGWHWA